MKELTDKWFRLIEGFSPSVQLALYVLTGIVFLFLFLMRFRRFRHSVFNFLERNIKISFRRKTTLHDLFFRNSYYDNWIRKINFVSEIKTFSIKSILKSKKEVVISVMKEFFLGQNLKNKSLPELFNYYVESLNVVVEKIEESAKKKHIEKYGDKGEKLFRYVYLNGIKPKQDKRIEHIIAQTQGLSDSRFLSVSDKTIIFLTFIMYALDAAIVDAEKAYASFNGEPDKIIKSE